MNLIRCNLCCALLSNDWDEKAHMAWHSKLSSVLTECHELLKQEADRQSADRVRLEGLADDMLNSRRVKYDADENTPYVDNAASVGID